MTSNSATIFRSCWLPTVAAVTSYILFYIVLAISAGLFNKPQADSFTRLADGTISGTVMTVCFVTPVTWRVLPGLAVGTLVASFALARTKLLCPVRWAIPVGVVLAVFPIAANLFSTARMVPMNPARNSWLWLAFVVSSLATAVAGVLIAGAFKAHSGDGPTNR